MKKTMQKSRKRLGALALATAMMLGALPLTAAAPNQVTTVTGEMRPQVSVMVDGVERDFYNAQGQQVYAVFYDGTHYLPVRAIGELMGKNVNWDQSTLTISLTAPRTTGTVQGTPGTAAQAQSIQMENRPDFTILVEGENRKMITTSLSDPVMEQQEGVLLDQAYDFEDYRQKVNRYVEEHGNQLAIHKLKHNLPLTEIDYRELEHILTVELGSREDYRREFGDTPFGLLIRKIAKLDHEAAMEAFSQFINDQSLTQSQIAFVHKVIHYVEQNGYMESVTALQKPPFDKPVSFLKLFNNTQREQLLQVIHSVKGNAENVIA